MKIRNCVLAIAISAIASTAMANDSVSAAMRDSLVQEQGYTELSEGFFVKKIGLQETYMSVGEAGRQAMAEQLIEQRNASQRAIEKRGGNSTDSASRFDGIIESLTRPEPKTSASQTGDCLGTQGAPTFYVSAQSSGGIFALANARNDAGIINTKNFTNVWTTNRAGNFTSEQVSTTYGATPSHSQVSIANTAMACESDAYASVTCPGHTNPSISLFITELKWWDCRN